MRQKFIAKITWLSKEQGGRQCLPNGDKYGCVMKVKNPINPIEKAFWSLVVENQKQVAALETIAEVYYLVDTAPDNLNRDVKFVLYEGKKKIADGIVIGVTGNGT